MRDFWRDIIIYELLIEGKRLGRVIKALIKEDEKRYYDEGLDLKSDPKKAWRNVRMTLNVEKTFHPRVFRYQIQKIAKNLLQIR